MAVSSDLTVKQRGGMGPHSRGMRCPSVAQPFTLSRGRRESRVHAAPAVSRANAYIKAHTSIQVQRRHSVLPCAMVLTVYFVLSPVTGLFLPPSLRRSSPQSLAPASGRQDHT